MGFSEYNLMTRKEREQRAISAQRADPSWSKTRQEFKYAIREYEKNLGIRW